MQHDTTERTGAEAEIDDEVFDDQGDDEIHAAEVKARGWRHAETLEIFSVDGVHLDHLSRSALEGVLCASLSIYGALHALQALADPNVAAALSRAGSDEGAP